MDLLLLPVFGSSFAALKSAQSPICVRRVQVACAKAVVRAETARNISFREEA